MKRESIFTLFMDLKEAFAGCMQSSASIVQNEMDLPMEEVIKFELEQITSSLELFYRYLRAFTEVLDYYSEKKVS